MPSGLIIGGPPRTKEVVVSFGSTVAFATDAVANDVAVTGRYLLSANLTRGATAAYFEASINSIAGGTLRIRLRDETAASDLATISGVTATGRNRSGNVLSSLTSGNEVAARYDVTTAGTAGNTAQATARLVLVYAE